MYFKPPREFVINMLRERGLIDPIIADEALDGCYMVLLKFVNDDVYNWEDAKIIYSMGDAIQDWGINTKKNLGS